MSTLLIVLIILILLGGGGGYYGYNRYGWQGYGPGLGILGFVIVALLLYWLLTGHIRP